MALEPILGQTVELDAKLKRQFYPILLLLRGLDVVTTQEHHRSRHADPVPDSLQTLEDVFHAFVCKVALLCCTEPSGHSVSACAVVQLSDRVQYVFASNNRKPQQLQTVASGVSSILSMLKDDIPSSSEERDSLHQGIFLSALKLCHLRVRSYLRGLTEQLNSCLEACKRDSTSEDDTIASVLQPLLKAAGLALTNNEVGVNEVVFPATIELITSINSILRRDVYKNIKARILREERLRSSTCWYELNHILGRLNSYRQTVDILFRARENWPELFDEFEFAFIPSSTKISTPWPTNPWAADKIITRLTSQPNLLSTYKTQVQTLQNRVNLDEVLGKLWRGESIKNASDSGSDSETGSESRTLTKGNPPKPIVHAEILIHHWLENTEGGIRPERFFGRYKFIGSSKPTCRLCSYFFQEYPTDVQVRESHRNIYENWRMPDIYKRDGDEAEKLRRGVMLKIKARMAQDIARAMSDRLAVGRPHDSDTYSMIGRRPDPLTLEIGSMTSLSDITESMNTLSLVSAQRGTSYIEIANVKKKAGSDDEDENDGGVLLYAGRRKG